uniref:ER-bound oxygenase mpaB/mpaB'/Rubber oxygenase catalytic domain-containing protein n=1 Tax=Entomoneis paludosa TaxID=265537 RepID=A0A7S3DV07_9STRA|mmetsp:Transcript_38538/g.80092  ORF Transcript_38538/g.80092 Transcript_38538/m.80092 type:complete len:485 (+) Transcript_38538:103-1557(+)
MSFRALNLASTRFPQDLSQWPKGAHRRVHFGQHILWHPYSLGGRHLEPEELSAYRYIGDPEVDDLISLLEAHLGRQIGAGEDILRHLEEASNSENQYVNVAPHSTQKELKAFYEKYSSYPAWVDTASLERGQEVFLAYLGAIGVALYYRSLVPGFSIPPLAHVLKTTGYLAPPSTKQRVQERLTDTFAMLILSLTQISSLQPGVGEGWKACLQVRFLHAKVRRAILSRSGKRSWQTEKYGVPINEEDMAATLLAFSQNSLVGTEILLGFPLPVQERRDFLAVWRYIGWLLGVRVIPDNDNFVGNDGANPLPRPLDPCGPGWRNERLSSIEHSQSMFESILTHVLHPDDSSIEVSHYLLWQGRSKDPQVDEGIQQQNWFYYRCLQCRRFIGDSLADELNLPLNPNRWNRCRSWIFSTLFLLSLSMYTAAALPWSPFRALIVSFHRKRLLEFSKSWHSEHGKRVHDQLSNGQEKGQSCQFAMLLSP